MVIVTHCTSIHIKVKLGSWIAKNLSVPANILNANDNLNTSLVNLYSAWLNFPLMLKYFWVTLF